MSSTTQTTSSNTTLSAINTLTASITESTPIASVRSSTAIPTTTTPSGISVQQSTQAQTTNTSNFLISLTSTKKSSTGSFNITDLGTVNNTSTPSSMNASVTATAKVMTSAQQESTPKRTVSLSTKQIGDCLRDSYYTNNDSTTNHTLTNICANEPAVGHVKENCIVTASKEDSRGELRLKKQADTHTVNTKQGENCQDPIQKGPAPRFDGASTASISKCIKDHFFSNGDGTISHKIVNTCSNKTRHGYITTDCSFYPAYKTNEFALNGKDSHIIILTYDTDNCKNSVHKGKATINDPLKPVPSEPKPTPSGSATYESQFCYPKNASLAHLPDPPKAEKIISGADLPTLNARYLVQVRGTAGTCTGTLIDAKHVLTAAHCVSEGNVNNRAHYQPDCLNRISVWHDPYPAKKGTQYIPRTAYQVKAGHISPCFHQEDYFHCDLAVLELQQAVSYSNTIQLPTADHFCEFAQSLDEVAKTAFDHPVSIDATHRTYNKTNQVWKVGNAITQGFGQETNSEGKIIDSNRAKQEKIVATQLHGNDKMIITEPRVQGGFSCLGDSGGPLLFETKSGKKVQIGITSTGEYNGTDCTDKLNTYYTNINPHIPWIRERIKENPDSVQINSGDLSRLRICPETCVERKDQPDGWLSWFGSFTFTIRGPRRLTFTNNCRGKNHPSAVNINFYSTKGTPETEEKLEAVYQIEEGKTKTFFTNGTPIKSTLAWSDMAK